MLIDNCTSLPATLALRYVDDEDGDGNIESSSALISIDVKITTILLVIFERKTTSEQ